MPQMIFVNLPVKNLDASKAFYEALGYSINAQFTNEDAACVVISETIYVMLLVHPFFLTFLPEGRAIADAGKVTQVLNCLSFDDRASLDAMMAAAKAAGGTITREAVEQFEGMMYGGAFADLDGHIWETMWMDPAMAGGQGQ